MIWIMQGLSSQRSLVLGASAWIKQNEVKSLSSKVLQVIASHSDYRPEITELADVSLQEPEVKDNTIAYIQEILHQYPVDFIHVGRNCSWYESHRDIIEQTGSQLITGALSLDSFQLADDKYRFTQLLEQNNMAVTPAKYVETYEQLEQAINETKKTYGSVCIKPNKGIYGIGFWILNDKNTSEKCFFSPEMHQMNGELYLSIVRQAGGLKEPLLVMPYLPGPEASVDMVVRAGKVIAAVGRKKIKGFQEIFVEGAEIDLASRCSALMKADGLINVQTREDQEGKIRILETNLRPSGGFGYSFETGINLAGILFADRYNYPLPSCIPKASKIKIIDQPVVVS